MKRFFKWFLIALVSAFLGLVGVSYYFYQKWTPQEIKRMLTTSLEDALPGSKVSLEKVEKHFGLVPRLSLEELDIEILNRPFLKVGKASVKLPLEALLFGLGSLKISLDRPQIYYQKVAKTKKSSPPPNSALAAFLYPLNLDVRLREAEFITDQFNLSSLSLDLVKLNVRSPFSLKATTRVESKRFKGGVSLKGTLDVSSLDSLTGQLECSLKDVQQTYLLPEQIKATLDVKMKFDQKQKSTVKLDLGVIGRGTVNWEQKGWGIDFNLHPEKLLSLPGEVRLGPGELGLKGNIHKLRVQGQQKVSYGKENLEIDYQVKLKKRNLKSSFTLHREGGKVQGDFNGALSESFDLLFSKTNLRVQALPLGPFPLSGQGVLQTKAKKISLKNFRYTYGPGKGHLELISSLKEKPIKAWIDFSIKNLDLGPFGPHFPKNFKILRGTLDLLLKGNIWVEKNGQKKADLFFNFLAQNGKVKDFKLEGYLREIFSQIPSLEYLNQKRVGDWFTGDFKKLSLQGKYTQEDLRIKQFHLQALKDKLEVKGRGHLRPQGSEFFVDIWDHKKIVSRPLEKYTGQKDIPLKLIGPKDNLKVDPQYTTQILLERGAKSYLGKNRKKLEKSLKKRIKKLFKF